MLLPLVYGNSKDEPNDCFEQATLLNDRESKYAEISTPDDVDYYKIILNIPNSILQINIHSRYYYLNLGKIYLYDSNQVLISSYTIISYNNRWTHKIIVPGIYYVKIEGNSFFTCTIVAETLYDEYEPNDNFSQAYYLSNNNLSSYIWTQNDVDYFRISVAHYNAILLVNLSNLTTNYDLYLYNSNQELVAISSNPTTNSEQILFSAKNVGDYYIKIVGVNGGYSNTAPYYLEIQTIIDAYEPNNNFSQAYPFNLILSGSNYSKDFNGIFNNANDSDYFKIVVNNVNTKLSMWLTSSVSCNLSLYDSKQTFITSSEYSYNLNIQIDTPGTYYIKVEKTDRVLEDTNYYLYHLYITLDTDNFEPNNSFVQAYPLEFNSQKRSNLWPVDDIDYYKITVDNIDAAVRIYLYSPTDCDMMLYDYNEVLIATTTKLGTYDKQIIYEPKTVGIYYIKIVNTGNASTNFVSYDITANLVKDEYEPNNNLAQAFTINPNTYIYSRLFPEDDVFDFYKIVITTANAIFNISLSNYDLFLYDFLGTLLTYDYNELGGTAYINYTISKAGTYYIRISNHDGTYNPNTYYSLNVRLEVDTYEPNDNFAQAVTIIPNQTISSYIYSPVDIDYYKIVIATTNMILEINNYYGVCTSLYDSNQIFLASTTYYYGDKLRYKVNKVGDYYVKIALKYYYSYRLPYYYYLNVNLITDIYEPNDNFEQAFLLTPNQLILSFISSKTDVDYYKIKTTENNLGVSIFPK